MWTVRNARRQVIARFDTLKQCVTYVVEYTWERTAHIYCGRKWYASYDGLN